VPLCRRLAAAGWQPVTRARTAAAKVALERFGESLLTVLNDSSQAQDVTITWLGPPPQSSQELLTGAQLTWQPDSGAASEAGVSVRLRLESEDVAVIELQPGR
jgi:3-hydroxyisobutyrate dehydrogenase-like beta-hydroxyacid dehydrogenase